MRFAIGRFRDCVQRALIKIADVNGPHCGVDKRCVVQLRLRSLPDVIFSITGTEAQRVVDQAAERVAQVLVRRLMRQRQVVRTPERLRASFQPAHERPTEFPIFNIRR